MSAEMASKILDASRPMKGRCPTCHRGPEKKKTRQETTDEEYRKMMWRKAVAYGERIRKGGPEILADVVALRDTLNEIIDAGVDVCRSELWSASWAEIGTATRTSRQRAQQIWGSLGGARQPGGQPSHLR
jgi:hypothetical protein